MSESNRFPDLPPVRRRPGAAAPSSRRLLCVLLGALLVGCTAYRSQRAAQQAEAEGDWDRAVLEYLELTHRDPDNLRYRSALLRSQIQASHAHFEKAKRFRDAGRLEQALVELQQAVQLDPTNQYARAELEKVLADLRAREEGLSAETLAELKERNRGARAQPPTLNPRSPEPIDLDFPRPQSVKQIYEALGKAFGINVLFDPKLRDQEISIQLTDVVAQDALEILMRTAGHFYKVLDEHSILVVADTPQNRRTYEDLIIQTFFLSNSDVKEVMTMLRSLVDSRKIAANEQLNAIILRDTADKVKVAERIIRANDKAKAEVVVDVELLQLNTNKLQELGGSLTSYQIGAQLDVGGEDVPIRFNDLQFLNANNWVLTLPNFLVDFVKSSSEAQTLAKPQLRISEGEQARLHIGERVPIPVTQFNTGNTVGSNVVPITSFQYQEVGIRIEIEPRVHHNNEVSLKVSIEISNLSGTVGNQPIIGTRTIETTIRLKDGETNFLAGLIREDETTSKEGLPGIGDVPLLGRLFSKRGSQKQRTDIVLTLTPHIIRRADITEDDLAPIWVGTESNITFRGGSPQVESPVEGPFDGEEEGEAGENLRERLRRLPRGLRGQPGQPGGFPEAEEDAEQEPAPPQGRDLTEGIVTNPLDRRPPPNLSSLEPIQPRGAGVSGGAPAGPAVMLAPILAQMVAAQVPEGTSRTPENERGRVARPSDARARLVASPSRVEPGEELVVGLEISSQSPVSHTPMTLRFDAERVELVSVRAGGWLRDGAEVEVLTDNTRQRRLIVGASRLGAVDGVSGTGNAVEVVFRALASGSAVFELEEISVLSPGLRRRNVTLSPTVTVAVGGPEGPGDPEPLRTGAGASSKRRGDVAEGPEAADREVLSSQPRRPPSESS